MSCILGNIAPSTLLYLNFTRKCRQIKENEREIFGQLLSSQREFMEVPEDRQSTEIEVVLSYRWLLEGLFLPAIGCVGIIGN